MARRFAKVELDDAPMTPNANLRSWRTCFLNWSIGVKGLAYIASLSFCLRPRL